MYQQLNFITIQNFTNFYIKQNTGIFDHKYYDKILRVVYTLILIISIYTYIYQLLVLF